MPPATSYPYSDASLGYYRMGEDAGGRGGGFVDSSAERVVFKGDGEILHWNRQREATRHSPG